MIKTLTPEEKLNVNGGWWQVVGVTILLDALLSELNVYATKELTALTYSPFAFRSFSAKESFY